uniref:anther-specific protein LAT52-like n=1 Tax=Fragaria vesca subsp. vesca TaxID=101020 RepID=UPI0005CAE166|nr:PREDICTED: anther-specific protein LAT52-like [Fragaria vesca subsp. vesca]
MAKNLEIVAIFLTVSCLLSLAYAQGSVIGPSIEGYIYCDPCRIQFPSNFSKRLPGAEVKLDCFRQDNQTPLYSLKVKTAKNGAYKFDVKLNDNMQDQICVVTAVSSNTNVCPEPFYSPEAARVFITKKSGYEPRAHFVDPLGFMKAKTSDECKRDIGELLPAEVAPEAVLPLDVDED